MSFTNNAFEDNWMKQNYCKYLELHAGHIFKTLCIPHTVAFNVLGSPGQKSLLM